MLGVFYLITTDYCRTIITDYFKVCYYYLLFFYYYLLLLHSLHYYCYYNLLPQRPKMGPLLPNQPICSLKWPHSNGHYYLFFQLLPITTGHRLQQLADDWEGPRTCLRTWQGREQSVYYSFSPLVSLYWGKVYKQQTCRTNISSNGCQWALVKPSCHGLARTRPVRLKCEALSPGGPLRASPCLAVPCTMPTNSLVIEGTLDDTFCQ